MQCLPARRMEDDASDFIKMCRNTISDIEILISFIQGEISRYEGVENKILNSANALAFNGTTEGSSGAMSANAAAFLDGSIESGVEAGKLASGASVEQIEKEEGEEVEEEKERKKKAEEKKKKDKKKAEEEDEKGTWLDSIKKDAESLVARGVQGVKTEAYIGKSIFNNPGKFVLGVSASFTNNILFNTPTASGVYREKPMIWKLENNEDYDALASYEAGKIAGDAGGIFVGTEGVSAGISGLGVEGGGAVFTDGATLALAPATVVEIAGSAGVIGTSLGHSSDDFKCSIAYAQKGLNGDKTSNLKANNMGEFFKNDFGSSIKNSITKTKNKFQNQPIYEISEKVENQYLKKGDKIYLDNLHKNHLEVFDKKGDAKEVLNLDGTLNYEKTEKVLNEKRKLNIK